MRFPVKLQLSLTLPNFKRQSNNNSDPGLKNPKRLTGFSMIKEHYEMDASAAVSSLALALAWMDAPYCDQPLLVGSAAAEAALAEGAHAERGTYASTWGIDPSSTPSVHSQTTAFRGHSFRARNSAAIVAAKMRYAAVIPCTMPQTGT